MSRTAVLFAIGCAWMATVLAIVAWFELHLRRARPVPSEAVLIVIAGETTAWVLIDLGVAEVPAPHDLAAWWAEMEAEVEGTTLRDGIPSTPVELADGNLFLRADGGWCVISGATPTDLEQLAHQILDAVRGAQ